ncbi:hypothetical protein, partial [Streptococcus sp. DD11]|uniref:hypothetical protein n=1 Tax=Streptococcus sp. DD11 TaxID=1777879 RepID=UPI0019D281E6
TLPCFSISGQGLKSSPESSLPRLLELIWAEEVFEESFVFAKKFRAECFRFNTEILAIQKSVFLFYNNSIKNQEDCIYVNF